MNSEDNALCVVEDNDDDVEDGLPALTEILYQPTGGEVTIIDDLTLEFTPDTGWTGDCIFEYRVQDSYGDDDTAKVTITVLENTPPVAVDDMYEFDEGSENNACFVIDNDYDNEDRQPDLTGISMQPQFGTAEIIDELTIIYTPPPGFTGLDQFEYQVIDSQGLTDTGRVQIIVSIPNTPPVANDDMYTIIRNTPKEINPLGNDVDNEDGIPTFQSVISPPDHGGIEITPDGLTIVYQPDSGYIGVDSFVYEVADSGGLTDTATVYLEIVDGLSGGDGEVQNPDIN